MPQYNDSNVPDDIDGCFICNSSNVSGASSCQGCGHGQEQHDDSTLKNSSCIDCSVGKFGTGGEAKCEPCPEGWFQDEAKKASCKKCPEGWFDNDAAGRECETCPAGFSGSEKGETSCNNCGEGTYQNVSGQTKCKSCEPGMFQNEENQDSCTICPRGFFASTSSHKVCKECPPGFYSAHHSSSKCEECTLGRYQAESGTASCIDCQKGMYSDTTRRVENCTNCPQGLYQQESGQEMCNQCPPGRYANETMSFQCLRCRPGSFSDRSSATNCQLCEQGKYTTNRSGFESCEDCPQGYFGNVTGGDSCEMCPQNYYTQETGKTFSCDACPEGYSTEDLSTRDLCDECNVGKFNDMQGGYCEKCPSGWISNEAVTQKNNCTKCSEGKYYLNTSARTYCSECARGMFQDEEAQIKCKSCSEEGQHKFQDKFGQEACLACKSGTEPNEKMDGCVSVPWVTVENCNDGEFLNNSHKNKSFWECIECPVGANCKNTPAMSIDNLGHLAGYWNVTWQHSKLPHNQLRTIPLFVACPFPDTCLSSDVGNKTERQLRETNGSGIQPACKRSMGLDPGGVLCAVCLEGYVRLNPAASNCEKCTSESNLSLLTIVAVVVFLLLLMYISRRIVSIGRMDSRRVRNIVRVVMISFSYLQISSSIPRHLSKNIPKSYTSFVKSFEFASLNLASLLSFKCVRTHAIDYRTEILLLTSVPVIWTALAIFAYRIDLSRIKTLINRKQHEFFTSKTIHAHNAGKKQKVRDVSPEKSFKVITRSAITYLFDIVDVDQDGYINEVEFEKLLRVVHMKRYKGAEKEVRSQILRAMSALGGEYLLLESYNDYEESESSDEEHLQRKSLSNAPAMKLASRKVGNQESILVLTRSTLQAKADSGELAIHIGTQWIYRAEHARVRAVYMGAILMFIFYMHAPISQEYFLFFSCHNVGGRFFVQGDYSLECHIGKHASFTPFVLAFLLLYTIALPLSVAGTLFCNRKALRKPQVSHQFGFLYNNFAEGAEAWEIHELARKCFLTGVIVFIPGASSRAVICVIFCTVNCCVLSYLRPHLNPVVFVLEFASFFLTTLKYFLIICLYSGAEQESNLEFENNAVGYGMLAMDLFFLLYAAVSVPLILAGVCHESRSNGDGVSEQRKNRRSLKLRKKGLRHKFRMHVKSALITSKIQTIISRSEASSEARKVEIRVKRRNSHSRLKARLKKSQISKNKKVYSQSETPQIKSRFSTFANSLMSRITFMKIFGARKGINEIRPSRTRLRLKSQSSTSSYADRGEMEPNHPSLRLPPSPPPPPTKTSPSFSEKVTFRKHHFNDASNEVKSRALPLRSSSPLPPPPPFSKKTAEKAKDQKRHRKHMTKVKAKKPTPPPPPPRPSHD